MTKSSKSSKDLESAVFNAFSLAYAQQHLQNALAAKQAERCVREADAFLPRAPSTQEG